MLTRDTITLLPPRAPLPGMKQGHPGAAAAAPSCVPAVLTEELHAAMRQFDGCTVLVTGGTGSFGRRFIETL
ncbi:MAG TPA: hypothetical protein VET85_07450, partial [Stellaceae bacterium]|nr:hypothetical protein [Stellaceae bacterium]